MTLTNNVLNYLKNSEEETLRLIEDIARIPAPSGQEDARADFCRNWLLAQGAEHVEIDDAKNVLAYVDCEGKEDLILFSAHTDVVFPDLEPLPFERDDRYLHAPGVGDDTACLAALLIAARYVIRNKLTSPYGVIFAANSCEEGLGNLKGIREIMRIHGDRIRRAYTVDGQYNAAVTTCVGSVRYRVTVQTEGGHSFNHFGNRNAIFSVARLLTLLNDRSILDGCKGKTTYNVGVIEGGTSVNTIAQSASFLYEFRSDCAEDLARMQRFFDACIARARAEELGEITVETVGIRPCGGEVDEDVLEEMAARVVAVSEAHSGIPCARTSGSTDCNIPMSMGVPAVCVGAYLGDGAHTREERVRIDSVPVGLRIVTELVLDYFNQPKENL